MTDLLKGVEKASRAVKIEVSTIEQEALARELDDFLQWLEPMLELNTNQAEQVLFSHGAVNVLREDCPRQSNLAELQEAAPNFAGGFYLVPPIIE